MAIENAFSKIPMQSMNAAGMAMDEQTFKKPKCHKISFESKGSNLYCFVCLNLRAIGTEGNCSGMCILHMIFTLNDDIDFI